MTQNRTNILLLAHGTRGDVQPFIALGKGLQARGRRVRIQAGTNFAGWIRSHGLEVATSSIDYEDLMNSEDGREWVRKGNNPYQQLRIMQRILNNYGATIIEDAWEACQDADLIISSFTSCAYTISIAQKLDKPHLIALLQPSLLATRDGRVMMNAPLANRTSWLNFLFAKLFIEPASWRLYGDITNRFRQKTLNLPPLNTRLFVDDFVRTPILLAYSPHVVPYPSEWPPNFVRTGYWFLHESQDWQPSPGLTDFLAAGDAPVYIGFGSMTDANAADLSRLAIDAVRTSGCRAVLHRGWAQLGGDNLPDSIFLIDFVPHDWLFPRMAAIVHHGGAGTTAAALAAGVPGIVIPHMSDQPFWGNRVAALGVGPRPIPRPKLTAEKLAAVISQTVSDRSMHERAAELGAAIRTEDGIGAAIHVIEGHLPD